MTAARGARLRILATTDLHGQVRDYDYDRDTAERGFGLSRVASLIQEARAEEPHCLLFDCGDSLFGSPLTDRDLGQGWDKNPMAEALSALGASAITLGNHDFELGSDRLNATLSALPLPVLASNYGSPSLPSLLDRLVLTVDLPCGPALKVGVIGLIDPVLLPQLPEVTHRPVAQVAAKAAATLRREGADLVIALIHGDLETAGGHETAVFDPCDVVLEGHRHLAFCRDVTSSEGRPRGHVQPGFWGSHLGVVDVDLRLAKQGWVVDQITSSLRRVAQHDPNGIREPLVDEQSELKVLSDDRHAETRAYLAAPVAHSAERLHSYMSVLGPNRLLEVVGAAQLRRARALLGPTDLPLLSAVSPQKTGGLVGPDHYVDVRPGSLTRRHLSALYGFPNRLAVVKLTGAELRKWLSQAAAIYRPLRPGAPGQPLVNPSVPSYLADRIYGVQYEIDLTDPSQVHGLTYGGAPIMEGDEVLVAACDFRINLGHRYAWLRQAERVIPADQPIPDLLEEMLRSGLPDRMETPFRLKWPAGATASELTAPAFQEVMGEFPDYEFLEAKPDPSGYLRLHFRPRTPISPD